ncbi:MAG: toxin-antitoxin system HicB family antitoxin [Chloroflexi bacterium]|nr:toxin-antitoxin system HicB family antitoxin [Chloroflexota bacterium]
MEKKLEYYMKLPYTILLKRDKGNEGNPCYIARVLEIPHVLGDGETPGEALECLNTHMIMAIEAYLRDGIAVPEPRADYSGNINIRVDPDLHARLAHEAAAHEMSLNKYTALVLERRQIAMPEATSAVKKSRASGARSN